MSSGSGDGYRNSIVNYVQERRAKWSCGYSRNLLLDFLHRNLTESVRWTESPYWSVTQTLTLISLEAGQVQEGHWRIQHTGGESSGRV